MQAIDAATLEIAEAVGTQSAATTDISRTVAQAAAARRESARGRAVVPPGAAQTAATTERLTQATGTLSALASDLDAEVETFLGAVAA